MKRAQCARGRFGLGAQSVTVDRLCVQELGDEVALAGRDERRTDAEPGSLLTSESLGLAVDTQQVRVAARQSQHALKVAEADPVIAVGDSALERHRRARGGAELRLQLLDDRPQVGHV